MSDWRYIQRFAAGLDEAPADRQRLGGKGAGLVEMSRRGVPIPPGFTIVISCCEHFHDAGGWPDGLDAELDAAMAWLEHMTGRPYGRGDAPLLVSVRSGAAVSMPGMMDTLLNCGLNAGEPHARDPRFEEIHRALQRQFHERMGQPLPEDPRIALRACIEAVWRSWLSARACTYRKRHGLTHLAGTAVNVQAMFPSQVSGVVFTRDPARPDSGQLIIEAAFGLGESVVAGDVTPDACRVDRASRRILSYNLGHKASIVRALGDHRPLEPDARCLTDEQVARLVELSLNIEAAAGAPADIEFGIADGDLAILQSRSIRGLDVVCDVEPARQEMVESLRRRSAGRKRLWIRHNLDETISHPTPMTWDILCRFMRGDGGFGRMYRHLGYRQDARFRREGFLDLIGGRIYADPERAAGLFWDGMPMAYDLDALSRNPSLMEQPPTVLQPEQADHRFLLKLPLNLWAMLGAARRIKRLRHDALRRFQVDVLPSYLAWVEAERGRDLRSLSPRELIDLLTQRRQFVLDAFGGESLTPGFFGALAYARLCANLHQIFGEREGQQLALELVMGLEDDMSVEQNQRLWRVAHGRETLEAFVNDYGHRALGEMELAQPRWSEDDEYLRRVLGPLARQDTSPGDRHRVNRARRQELEVRLPVRLAEAGAASLRETLFEQLRTAQQLLPWRENGKHYLMMGYRLVRQALVMLGERWGIGGDVFYLTLDELPRFEADRNARTDVIARRKTRTQSQRHLMMPTVIDSGALDRLGLASDDRGADGDAMEGQGISAGVATGRAVLVEDPNEATIDDEEAILVCHSTDPAWTALFAQVRAVVVERGGALSHGAIVARDFGLPAIVCDGAMRRIAHGRRITVDANRGRVILHDDALFSDTGNHAPPLVEAGR